MRACFENVFGGNGNVILEGEFNCGRGWIVIVNTILGIKNFFQYKSYHIFRYFCN